MINQNNKFIATQPTSDVFGSDGGAKAFSDFYKYRITRIMPVSIVYKLNPSRSITSRAP